MPKKSDKEVPKTPANIKSSKPAAKLSAASARPAATSAKSTAGKSTRSPARKKAAAPPKAQTGPAFEDIQLRAYFVAEQRLREGRPGDERQDWIEAERQLVAEQTARPGRTAKAPARRRKSTGG